MDTTKLFQKKFGKRPQYKISVPSRVVLIGEHSDYFENYILAMAADNIRMDAYVAPRKDDKIRILSQNLKANKHAYFEFSTKSDRVKFQWIQYVQGAIAMFAEEFTRGALKGFDLLIDSKIPIGAGLSSSSTLTMTALSAIGLSNGFTDGDRKISASGAVKLVDQKSDSRETHKLLRKHCMMGCWAEYWYGTRGGAMDHFTVTVSRKNFATLLDNRPYEYEYVPISSGASFIVCNTMVKHNQLFNGFAKRKEDAWNGLSKLEKYLPKAKNVRDITLEQLNKHKKELTDIEYRRMKHPITEKNRLFEFVETFKKADFVTAGKLLNQTHQSLDKDYEVTCSELNIMQKTAVSIRGCFGARMIGGGFGGCVLALVSDKEKDQFIKSIKQKYNNNAKIAKLKIKADVWEAISGDGLSIIKI